MIEIKVSPLRSPDPGNPRGPLRGCPELELQWDDLRWASPDGGGAQADVFGVVGEVDRYLGVVRTDLLESVLVGVVELGAVGADQDGTGIDEFQKTSVMFCRLP